MNTDIPFGAWLKQQRRALDRSREQLAGQIGCSISLLEKLETDERRPSRAMAERIALCLAIPAEQRDAFLAAARAGRAPHDHGRIPTHTAPLAAVPLHTSHLPAAMTTFIGREWEIATVSARLRTPEVRLLTLTGAGGVGKTRLALQIGSALHDAFPNGVWFVNLAPISDSVLVISTIVQTLGVREQPGMPSAESLCAALHKQQLLLLLDNFEQVVAAAPELALLLTAVPGLKLLVTSREALRLSGEHVVVVAPLAVPDPAVALPAEHLAQYAAAQLFVARAQAASDQFRLTDANASAVAAICARLDGLPLAIELATARIKLFPPKALLARLSSRLALLTSGPRDLPARQQTLRNAIAWSYDLLNQGEQTLFRRLGVFVGGFTLEVAEAVTTLSVETAGPTPVERFEPSNVLDLLAALLDKSLVRQVEGQDGDQPRFIMLETIREYALEQLELSGEAAASRRQHAAYYLTLAEATETPLRAASQPHLAQLEIEHDNIRTTLAWALGSSEAEMLGRLASALGYFWAGRGYLSEGQRWLADALVQSHVTALTRARVLNQAGSLASMQGDLRAARQLLEESLALFRSLGRPRDVAEVLNTLGGVIRSQGNLALTETLFEEGLALSKEIGDTWNVAWMYFGLRSVARSRTDYSRANAFGLESLTLFRSIGDEASLAAALGGLGHVARSQGNDATAAAYYAESLTIARAIEDKAKIALVLHNQAYLEMHQGASTRAEVLLVESLILSREIGQSDQIAWDLAGLGGVSAMQGHPEQAIRLLGAAEAWFDKVGRILDPTEQAEHEGYLAAARAQLDDATFEIAWAAGRAMTLEQAIAEALDVI